MKSSISTLKFISIVLFGLLFCSFNLPSFIEIFEPPEEEKIELEAPKIEELVTTINQLIQQKNEATGQARQDLQKEINQLRRKAFQLADGEMTVSSSSMMMEPASCPIMQVEELFGVPGFSETNELVLL